MHLPMLQLISRDPPLTDNSRVADAANDPDGAIPPQCQVYSAAALLPVAVTALVTTASAQDAATLAARRDAYCLGGYAGI